jgi:hypothetical protein
MTHEYTPTDGEVETAFHEYASQVVKREKEWVPDDEPMSYPPELEDWKCGMAAYRRWLAAHNAQIRAEALTLTDKEAYVAAEALDDADDESWYYDDKQQVIRDVLKAVASFRKEQKQ